MNSRTTRRNTPQQFQRETNIGLVLRALREEGPASRSELAEAIGIDRSTMTSIASELIATGLIFEAQGDPPGSRGGRRRQILSLASERVLTAGIDIDHERALWTLCTLAGEVSATGTVRRTKTDPAQWIGRAVEESESEIRVWCSSQAGAPPVLAGVGVGIPGVYDPSSRTLRESVVLGCRNVNLGGLRFSADGALDPLIDNDANCCAWNIADSGGTAGTTIFVQLKLHCQADGGFGESVAGVGLSFVMDGRVYYGSSHAAGELKGYRWTADHHDQLGMEPKPAITVESVIRELLQNLGVIASALDPSRIVLGGDLSNHKPVIHKVLEGDLSATAAAGFYQSGVLQVAGPGEYSVSEGAARMVLHELFALPVLREHVSQGLTWRVILSSLSDHATLLPTPPSHGR